jgi:hypothetical protein
MITIFKPAMEQIACKIKWIISVERQRLRNNNQTKILQVKDTIEMKIDLQWDY